MLNRAFNQKVLMISVWLIALSETVWAQKAQLSGIVCDSLSNAPLVGANVILKGTFLGAATDQDGKYSITNIAPGNYQIEVLMIGYRRQFQSLHLRAGEKVSLDFRLAPQVLKTPEIMVTGAKRAIRKADSPVSISAISPTQIAARNPASVDEVLTYDAAVQLIDGQINIRGSSGYTRGAGSRVAMLVDGAPAISFDNGSIYWEAIPVDEIERIEILKGPGSALYGSSAIGGVVNLITRKIPAGKATQLLLGGGFYSQPSQARQQISTSPLLSQYFRLAHRQRFGKLAAQMGVRYNATDGYHQNGWYRRWFLDGKIEYDWTGTQSLVSRIFWVDDVHGSFTQWRDAAHPFHTPLNTIHDRIFSHKLQWSTQYVQVLSSQKSLILRGNYFQTGFRNDLYNNKTHSEARTGSMEAQLDFRPNAKHYFTTGIEGRLNQVEANIWGSHNGYDLALYLQDEVALIPRVQVTGGLRFDTHRTDKRAVESQVNPKLGMVYHLSPLLTLRSSIGWAYRAPAIAEMFIDSRQYIFEVKPNPNLKSEKSFSYEAGCYFQSQRVTVDFALFSTNFKHLIDPVLDPTDNKIHFQNITDARVSGVEISGEFAHPGLPLQSKVSYTYLYPEDLTRDEQLPYRHNHSLVISEQLALTKTLIVGLDYRYLSKINRVQLFPENPVTGADKLVPIKLVSGFCHFSPMPALTFNLSVENLLQYYYVVIERNMGPTRNVRLTAEYTF